MEKVLVIENEYAPIVKHPDGHGVYIYYGFEPEYIQNPEGEMVKSGFGRSYMYHMSYTSRPPMEAIKMVILSGINRVIDEKIYSGFTWNGKTVYLSSENQFNYKAAYDIAVQTNGMNLPVTFKIGTDQEPNYVTFTTLEEFQAFFFATVAFIQQCLSEGWQLKDNFDWSPYEKALEELDVEELLATPSEPITE